MRAIEPEPKPSIPLLIAALFVHLFIVYGVIYFGMTEVGEDFPSYYYAAKAYLDGLNPWDSTTISQLAHADGYQKVVHPFLYPPPFLLLFWPLAKLPLALAFKIWFHLIEVSALTCAVLMYRWLRGLHASVPLLVVVTLAAHSAIVVNHLFGQVNLIVLMFALIAGLSCSRGKPIMGGVALGFALSIKLMPGLLLVGWIISKEHKAAVTAIITGACLVLMSAIALPISHNISFYSTVLPSLSSGGYNELLVPVSIFGNHSFAQIYGRFFFNEGGILPTPATWLHRLTVATVVVWALVHTRNKNVGAWARPIRFAILCAASMMIPIYVFEHHLVWLMPAMLVGLTALSAGKLNKRWTVPLVISFLVAAFPLTGLKLFAEGLVSSAPIAVTIIDEIKFMSILLIVAANGSIKKT